MSSSPRSAYLRIKQVAERIPDFSLDDVTAYLASSTFNENAPPRLAILMGASTLSVADHFCRLPLASVRVVVITGGIGRSTARLLEQLKQNPHPGCHVQKKEGQEYLVIPAVAGVAPHGDMFAEKPIFDKKFDFDLPPSVIAEHATEADVYLAVLLHALPTNRKVRVLAAHGPPPPHEDVAAIKRKLFEGQPGEVLHVIVENGSTQTGANVKLTLAALRRMTDTTEGWDAVMSSAVVVQQPMLQLRSELTFQKHFGVRPLGSTALPMQLNGQYTEAKGRQLWAALGEDDRLRRYPTLGYISQPPPPPKGLVELRELCEADIACLHFDGL